MKKYIVTFTCPIEIEAESKDEARETATTQFDKFIENGAYEDGVFDISIEEKK